MIRTAVLLLAILSAAHASAQDTPAADAAAPVPVPAEDDARADAPAPAPASAAAPGPTPMVTSTPTPPADDPAVARARALFAKMEAGEAAFDPAVADLYCDDALIRNTSVQPDGSQRVLEIPAPRYKALIRTQMPMAARRADRTEYSDVVAVAVDGGVRVTASRHSLRKSAVDPVSLLVGDCAGGGYGIREEISQSTP